MISAAYVSSSFPSCRLQGKPFVFMGQPPTHDTRLSSVKAVNNVGVQKAPLHIAIDMRGHGANLPKKDKPIDPTWMQTTLAAVTNAGKMVVAQAVGRTCGEMAAQISAGAASTALAVGGGFFSAAAASGLAGAALWGSETFDNHPWCKVAATVAAASMGAIVGAAPTLGVYGLLGGAPLTGTAATQLGVIVAQTTRSVLQVLMRDIGPRLAVLDDGCSAKPHWRETLCSAAATGAVAWLLCQTMAPSLAAATGPGVRGTDEPWLSAVGRNVPSNAFVPTAIGMIAASIDTFIRSGIEGTVYRDTAKAHWPGSLPMCLSSARYMTADACLKAIPAVLTAIPGVTAAMASHVADSVGVVGAELLGVVTGYAANGFRQGWYNASYDMNAHADASDDVVELREVKVISRNPQLAQEPPIAKNTTTKKEDSSRITGGGFGVS